ncbi:MAG: GAF domain-containing protein [Sphingomicrobium sp.]
MSAIQPCALLLLVGPDWRVETVSINVAMLGDVTPAEVLDRPLSDLIGGDAIHSLRNRVSWLASDTSEVQDFGIQWRALTFDVRAAREGDRYLIEAEPTVEPRLADGIGMVRSMTDRLTGNDPRDLAAQAMRQFQALTGFEWVLLCDRRGRRIAGNSDEQAEMPTEAVSTPRLIADRDAATVPLEGKAHGSLIARATFLAPGESDLEQLASHGVAATMALPLRIDGELVGAVHALHPDPRRCGAERRSIAHLFAERVAARMARHGWEP